MQTINVQDLQRIHESGEPIFIVDVRSSGEFQAGHIPGAVNIPMERCESRLADIPVQQKVALVCQSGQRAGITCDLLQYHRTNLSVLEGGTKAWQDAGLPIVTDQATRWSLERQTRLGAGIMVLVGVFGSLAFPPLIWLAAFAGAGLTFAGLTDVCGMGIILAKMPWNKPKAINTEKVTA